MNRIGFTITVCHRCVMSARRIVFRKHTRLCRRSAAVGIEASSGSSSVAHSVHEQILPHCCKVGNVGGSQLGGIGRKRRFVP
jgi:hypothetical protein